MHKTDVIDGTLRADTKMDICVSQDLLDKSAMLGGQ
jgi:hypothetical protein